MALTVAALAGQTGLSADTVRYYERVGLLPEPARSAAGYRLYDQAAIGRLRLIKSAQRAGLRLREIGELLQVADHGQCPCGHTEDLLRRRLAEVRGELDRLRALEADLNRLLERQPDPSCPEMTVGAGQLVVRSRLSGPLRHIGREVTTMPLLDCPCGPDCPCDDCPPGCCWTG